MSKKPTKLTRRQFISRGTCAIGAALAAPCIVPPSVLGKNGATAPGDRITMGFIGLGSQGMGHLRGGSWTYIEGGYLGRGDVQVLAVCDVRKEARDRAAHHVNTHYAGIFKSGSYNGCVAYADFRNLLARPDIDAVLIAAPNHWHAPMTIMAAQAGKDIYCEKPTAITPAESREAADAVRRYARVFQAGTQQRSEYGGKYHRACELVRNGRIGKLLEVYSYKGAVPFEWVKPKEDPKPEPAGFDWDLWLGPVPWVPHGSIMAGPFLYGGNWEQHHFDIVQWGIGADRTGPVEVSGSGCRYANGVVVRFGAYQGRKIGDNAGAWFIGSEGKIGVDRDNLAAEPPEILDEPLGPNDIRLYKCTSHSNNFLECVRSRKPTICDAETAHRSICIPLLAGIAKKLGRTLAWDPVKERFVNDEQADRLLSYARRPLPPLREESAQS